MDKTFEELKAKGNKYDRFLEDMGAERVLRELINKTFVARYEFEATYHELYKAEDGKYFAAVRIDPAPGGYGEEYMYVTEVYEADIDIKGDSYSDEELLQLVLSEGKKVELAE